MSAKLGGVNEEQYLENNRQANMLHQMGFQFDGQRHQVDNIIGREGMGLTNDTHGRSLMGMLPDMVRRDLEGYLISEYELGLQRDSASVRLPMNEDNEDAWMEKLITHWWDKSKRALSELGGFGPKEVSRSVRHQIERIPRKIHRVSKDFKAEFIQGATSGKTFLDRNLKKGIRGRNPGVIAGKAAFKASYPNRISNREHERINGQTWKRNIGLEASGVL